MMCVTPDKNRVVPPVLFSMHRAYALLFKHIYTCTGRLFARVGWIGPSL